MTAIRAKKRWGQHFLKEEALQRRIVALLGAQQAATVLEIGPGTGALTRWLLQGPLAARLRCVEIDPDLTAHLQRSYPTLQGRLLQGDFLTLPWAQLGPAPLALISNLPYYVGSPILWRLLEGRAHVSEAVVMLQQEVAQRLAAPPGSRTYGLLSVLLQAFYHVQYAFEVRAEAFAPAPKVDSAVLRLQRRQPYRLPCEEGLFFQVVKASFAQRRKRLRNALKGAALPVEAIPTHLATQRAEALSVADFVALTAALSTPRFLKG